MNNRRASLFTDVFILMCVVLITLFIRNIAIPYISGVYQLTADAIRMEYGAEGLLQAMFSGSPAQWFQTSISSMALPEYKWYTALMLALTTYIVTSDVHSYLNRGWLERSGMVVRLIAELISAQLFTQFMLALMTLALITVCPQNLPPLFQIIESMLICLPAVVHFFWRLNKGTVRITLPEIILSVLRVVIIYFSTDNSVFSNVLLMLLCLAEELYDRPDRRRVNLRQPIGFIVGTAWIIAVCAYIYPYVQVHMPEKVEEHIIIKIDSIEARNADSLFIREDGAAIDIYGNVYIEDAVQIAICKSNRFFLTHDGIVYACAAPGTIPAKLMDNAHYIDSYDDALIIVDKSGELWGFGDFSRYMPNGEYLGQPSVIVSGLSLVKADIGKGHILMVDGSGRLYSMGENTTGELGNGETSLAPQGIQLIMTDIVDAKAGASFSYALDSNGVMYAWGRNDVGQLGVGVQPSKWTVSSGPSINKGVTLSTVPTALEFDGECIIQIAVGAECGFALDSAHRLWVWGKNITSSSLSKPVVKTHGVAWIGDNKYQAGINDQDFYFIDEDKKAYIIAMGSSRSSESNVAKLIFDESDWFPEPIEVINSKLTELLESLNWYKEPEPETPAPYQTIIKAPTPEDNSLNYKYFGGHTYRIIDELMYTQNAETYCESMGGHLVSITSKDEHDFVAAMAKSGGEGFYGTALKSNGAWYWLTGEDASYIASLGYEAAFDDERGNGYINRDGKLNVGMMVKHWFICEWDYQ